MKNPNPFARRARAFHKRQTPPNRLWPWLLLLSWITLQVHSEESPISYAAQLQDWHRAVQNDAAPALNERSGLDDYLNHALLHHAGLQAAYRTWQAGLAKIPQARAWPDPQLTYGYFAREIETRVGPQQHRIGIMQMLPWLDALRAAGDMASAEAAEAMADWAALKLEIVRDVKVAWFELAWLEEARRITQENIELMRQLEAVAQTKFKAGGNLGPVTKAQVEIGKLQDRLASLEDRRIPLRSRLNALLNRESNAPFATPNQPPPLPDLPSDSQLLAWQTEANPILLRWHHRVERESEARNWARSQGRPQLGLGLDYVVTGEARMPGMQDSGQDAVIAMVSLKIPLWRGKYRAIVREAQARQEAALLNREQYANQVGSQLRMALYTYRDAQRKQSLYAATLLPQARSALNVAQQNYEAGQADFLSLIDAQRVYLDFRLERQRALVDGHQALAHIEQLVGREQESFPPNDTPNQD